MASVRDIARHAGVSITTVSRVLNNYPHVSTDARERVLAAANRSRYSAAYGRKSTANIALLYTGDMSISSPFDAALLYGITLGLSETDMDLMILDARRLRLMNASYSQMFMRKGVRGVILRTTSDTRTICLEIAEEGFPSIVVGDRFDAPSANYIYANSRESSQEAVDHLIGMGHRRIAFCSNIIDDSDHADRLAGYTASLAAHGIPLDNRYMLRTPANRDGGVQLLRRFMTMVDRPTAMFIADPMLAAGVIGEAAKLNVQIPKDLSVVGFDDTDLRLTLSPKLTAVCQDASQLGREAVAGLLTLLDAGADSTTQVIPDLRAPATHVRKSLRTWLEIHGSTSALAEEKIAAA